MTYAHPDGRPQRLLAAVVMVTTLLLSLRAGAEGGNRIALLSLVGFAAGFSLYRASFGFASAWRSFFFDRRSIGIRAQIVMLAATIPIFFILLGRGAVFGHALNGFVAPVGAALILGAFLFGIGMQLGGGCASGTLYTAGGGSARMMVTLTAFVAGSLIATANPLGWLDWPEWPAWSVVDTLGSASATSITLIALAIIYIAVSRMEFTAHGQLAPLSPAVRRPKFGEDWSLLAGAFSLALVNTATLVIAGRPWGITSAFALWGAKGATWIGIDVAGWRYWHNDASLTASVFGDATSVMDFGLILGAVTAAASSGRFRPSLSISRPALLTAIAGGLLMGIGARLATGCNIGAYFSGIASGSLHGLVWVLAAVPGSLIGVHVRRRFEGVS